MASNAKSLLNNTERRFEENMTSKMDEIGIAASDYVKTVEKERLRAKRSFESLVGRKKFIDIIIITALACVPVLTVLMVYVLFFE